MTALLLFATGVVFEVAYLWWLYCANCGWPLRTAAMSMVVSAISLYGMLEVVDHRYGAVWLVLGYGVGSYIAATVKKYHG